MHKLNLWEKRLTSVLILQKISTMLIDNTSPAKSVYKFIAEKLCCNHWTLCYNKTVFVQLIIAVQSQINYQGVLLTSFVQVSVGPATQPWSQALFFLLCCQGKKSEAWDEVACHHGWTGLYNWWHKWLSALCRAVVTKSQTIKVYNTCIVSFVT